MTATVFKKFNAYAEWFKKYDNDWKWIKNTRRN
jgi:hypothetical protein